MTGMIEMFSKEETMRFGMAFFSAIIAVILTVLIREIIDIFKDKKKLRKLQQMVETSKNVELTVFVSDDEYYRIAQKALDEQKMLEFKCYMDGIDKAIKVLKGGE